jgi:two-component system, chemotaxis family, sensor kinase CheA
MKYKRCSVIKNYKVVVVDDEKHNVANLEEILGELGAQVVSFTDPLKAINYIVDNTSQIALIISDFKMGDMDGFDLKSKINPIAADIPFCIVTAFWSKKYSLRSMDLGIKSFLEKPIQSSGVKSLIEKFAVARVESLEDEREMIEGFLEETTPMLEEIENLILDLENDPKNDDALAVYFRLLHTIKGTASCVGLIKLGEFTHHYEDFIVELRTGKLKVTTKSINVLLLGLDRLKSFFVLSKESASDEFIDVELETVTFKNFDEQDKEEFEGISFDNVEKSVDVEVKSKETKETKDKSAEKVSVGMDLLDQFMEENGELTVVRNSIIKTVKQLESKLRGDSDIEILNESLQSMYEITSNIQNKITEMRKVPLKNIFRPFKRLVRDMSKSLDKDVELTVTGEEFFVDNVIAKLYSNTLIHLIRNSLDHGIETKAERIKKGKDATGKLDIKIEEKGEDIYLEITDDGNGIDPNFISKLALEKGLYSQDELSKMSKQDILSIIFHSGFSTAKVVSDISGRGVGMDMVRGSFEDLGGQIVIDSEAGKGSVFKLSVPIPKSILILNSLQVESNNNLFLFSMDEVVEVLRLTKNTDRSRIDKVNGTHFLRHNSSFYELCFLDEFFYHTEEKFVNEDINIVVIRHKSKTFGVVVDKIFEFEEVVMRKINHNISNASIYQGAALLGSGDVSLILSSEGIMDKMGFDLSNLQNIKQLDTDNNTSVVAGKEYILFKNNTQEQLAVELEFVHRFEKIKRSAFEKTGDTCLINYNDKVLPIVDPFFSLSLHNENYSDHLSEESYNIIVLNINNTLIGLIIAEIGDLISNDKELNGDTINMAGLKGSLYENKHTVCVIDEKFIIDRNNWLVAPSTLKNNFEEVTESDELAFDWHNSAA